MDLAGSVGLEKALHQDLYAEGRLGVLVEYGNRARRVAASCRGLYL